MTYKKEILRDIKLRLEALEEMAEQYLEAMTEAEIENTTYDVLLNECYTIIRDVNGELWADE